MMRESPARHILAAGAIALAVIACNVQLAPQNLLPPTTALPSATAALNTATVAAASPTTGATPATPATSTVTAGPPPAVTVSAVGGRLNVRRGPGPEYDFVGALLEGQSALATARNADSTWVLVNAPNSTRALGWVIITTKYTSVGGPVGELPLLTVGAAVPAYIRNCTPHEMLVSPNGSILLDRSSTPENQLQFFPGEYTVIDMTTESEVASVTVLEGRTIDIKKDGGGSNYNCP